MTPVHAQRVVAGVATAGLWPHAVVQFVGNAMSKFLSTFEIEAPIFANLFGKRPKDALVGFAMTGAL